MNYTLISCTLTTLHSLSLTPLHKFFYYSSIMFHLPLEGPLQRFPSLLSFVFSPWSQAELVHFFMLFPSLLSCFQFFRLSWISPSLYVVRPSLLSVPVFMLSTRLCSSSVFIVHPCLYVVHPSLCCPAPSLCCSPVFVIHPCLRVVHPCLYVVCLSMSVMYSFFYFQLLPVL